MRRKKQTVSDDEERPMRRVSYLRATANENSLQIQGDSDMDNSPMSAAADTPETDIPITQLLKRFVKSTQHFYLFHSNALFYFQTGVKLINYFHYFFRDFFLFFVLKFNSK